MPEKPSLNAAQTDWRRKSHSSSYIRSAKRFATMLKDYIESARPVLVKGSPPPTRKEFRAILHNFLEPMTFEERRRSRRTGEGNSGVGSSPSPSDWTAPTTSLPY